MVAIVRCTLGCKHWLIRFSPSFEIRSEALCPSAPLWFSVWWACLQPYRTQAAERVWVVSGIADQRTIGTTTGNNLMWMVAYPLQIRWRDSDTSRFSLAAVSATATATTTPSPTAPAAERTAGRASATVIGLTVGCTVLAVVILLGIVAILVYRRRHRRQVRESLAQALHTGRGELAAGPGIAEMPDGPGMTEMPE